jgi:hypothetical protein
VSVIDYLIGDDAYKKLWMNQRRERWGLECAPIASVAGWPVLVRLAARTLLSTRRQ